MQNELDSSDWFYFITKQNGRKASLQFFFVKVNPITYANHSTRYELISCSSYYAEGYPKMIHFIHFYKNGNIRKFTILLNMNKVNWVIIETAILTVEVLNCFYCLPVAQCCKSLGQPLNHRWPLYQNCSTLVQKCTMWFLAKATKKKHNLMITVLSVVSLHTNPRPVAGGAVREKALIGSHLSPFSSPGIQHFRNCLLISHRGEGQC